MKFLADQIIERRLASHLKQEGHDIKVISVDYPHGLLDDVVLALAYQEKRILLTNDRSDFGELIFRFHHPHSGVILFRYCDQGIFSPSNRDFPMCLRTTPTSSTTFLLLPPPE
jgi:predicted nuclease of predicted toxin-antitoxin system